MNLKKFISGVSALAIAASAFAAMAVTANAAAHAITLTDSLTISGFKAKAFYNFQSADVQAEYPVTSSRDTDARYRTDGNYGIFNYGSGARTGTVSISVAEGDIVVVEHYQNQTYADEVTVNGKSADANLTALAGYSTYAIAADSETLAFGLTRAEYVTGILIMEIDTDTPVDTLVVNYKYGDDVVFTDDTIDIAGKHVGDSMTVPFRAYVEKDGVLYETTKNSSNPWYGTSVTLSADTVVTKSVTPVNIEGTVELLADLDDTTSENSDIRASYQQAYNNKSYTSPNEIPAGKYTFIVYALNKGRGSSIVVGDTTVATIDDVNTTKGAWTWKTFENIEITDGGYVSLAKGGNKTIDCYDVIVAIKTGDIPVTTTDAGFTFKSTIEKLAGSTVTLKVTASNGMDTKEGAVDITDKLDGFDGELMLAVILTDIPEGVTIESATIEVE